MIKKNIVFADRIGTNIVLPSTSPSSRQAATFLRILEIDGSFEMSL